jgi:hypothetical protein
MTALTRKRVTDRPETWHIHYAGVRVGVIVEKRSGARRHQISGSGFVGFYPDSNPGDDRHGTAASFEAARRLRGCLALLSAKAHGSGFRGTAAGRGLARCEICAMGSPRRRTESFPASLNLVLFCGLRCVLGPSGFAIPLPEAANWPPCERAAARPNPVPKLPLTGYGRGTPVCGVSPENPVRKSTSSRAGFFIGAV